MNGTPDGSYLVRQIELYNWGPFAGLHRLEIDPAGTAIIGQTGSGKTTIVDALTTLLAERPLYNLASTGGHESDRDLISYVRGVTGSGNDTGDNAHVARNASCLSGIGLRVERAGSSIFLGALLSIEGTGFAAADLKRLWLLDLAASTSLTDWLEHHAQGGMRAARHHARNASEVQSFDSKRAYLARVRRLFDVSENAFELLNRAAGLKQLNSIDELFRELVLDDHAMFGRAAEVIEAFNDLQAIHHELEVARSQQRALRAVAAEHAQWQKHIAQQQKLEAIREVLPRWFAHQGVRIWSERARTLDADVTQAAHAIASIRAEQSALQPQVDELHRVYIEAGGGAAESLRDGIEQRRQLIAMVQRSADDYQRVCAAHGWPTEVDPDNFADNQRNAAAMQAQLREAQSALTAELEQHTTEAVTAERDVARLRKEMAEAKAAPSSNLPAQFQQFKAELAAATGTQTQSIAFVAELLEVPEAHAAWRGAIERALGAHRLRLVVPGDIEATALHWVNARDNRLHVRLLGEDSYSEQRAFLADGFSRKLEFKAHPRREAVKRLIANIDRHCVDSPEALRTTPHAMTMAGLMSQQRGVFDKQDQRRVTDDWLTGFDNRDLLRRLGQALETAAAKASDSRRAVDALAREHRAHEQGIEQLHRFRELAFDDINTQGFKDEMARMEARLAALLDPDSDMAIALEQWQTARARLEQLHAALVERTGDEQRFASLRDAALRRVDDARDRLRPALSEADLALGDAAFALPQSLDAEQLGTHERDALTALQSSLDQVAADRAGVEVELGRLMERAQKVDTGALSEVGTELDDVPAYLEQLRVLSDEALPDKQTRFLAYLNKSSDEGVTQLLRSVDGEVYRIEERIDDINHTMQRVDFMPGCFLRLEHAKVGHERIRALQQAQRRLQGASLADDEGSAHYRALIDVIDILKEAVDNPRRRAARALLDPRYRLRFSVSVVSRQGARIIESRTGSQGGSGGEKEIIASYVLTASLAYALCPDGSSAPLFGTVILDEAFSKSSMAVASRIVAALREFGLHPLFVTPNKEMRLLRAHTRSAIVVHRTGNRSAATSLSWEELDAKAAQRRLVASRSA